MSFSVKIEPSGELIEVAPDESVLHAGLRHGLGFPYSCRDGLCGTCRAVVSSGSISYIENIPCALSDEEKRNGVGLMCIAVPTSDLVIQLDLIDSPIESKKLPCRVLRKEVLAPDVMAIWLKLPPTEHMDFHAGQYIDILLKDGRNRSFSIANAPSADNSIELHIRHIDGGDFTAFIFDELKEKDILRIEGPLGSFYLREDTDKPIIFMAGGTGFAPIKGIIEYCIEQSITRPMFLYWGAQALPGLYQHDLALQWAERHEHIQYVPVLSNPDSNVSWQGRTGYVHDAIAADFSDLSNFDIYAGGPPVMVYAGKDVFVAKGLPLNRYFSDAFEFQAHKAEEN